MAKKTPEKGKMPFGNMPAKGKMPGKGKMPMSGKKGKGC